MSGCYTIKINKQYKKWLALQAAKENKSIYQVFEQTLFPYYCANFSDSDIQKISSRNFKIFLSIPQRFKETLKIEAK